MNTTSAKLGQLQVFAFNVASVCSNKLLNASQVIKNVFIADESSEDVHECGSECSECCSDIRSISMASSSEFSPMFPRDSLSLQSSKRLSKQASVSESNVDKENTPIILPKIELEDISVFNKSKAVIHSPIKQSSNKKRQSNEMSSLS